MKNVLTALFFAICALGYAQEDTEVSSFGSINLGLHGAEFSFELPLSNSFMWENSLGLGMGSRVPSNGVNYTFEIDNPAVYLKSELKYVYNREKRISQNRGVANNSGNYLGLQTKYSFGDSDNFNLNQTFLTEVHWGIQRPMGKRFIFNLHLGAGVILDFDTMNTSFTPAIGVNFGYKLF